MSRYLSAHVRTFADLADFATSVLCMRNGPQRSPAQFVIVRKHGKPEFQTHIEHSRPDMSLAACFGAWVLPASGHSGWRVAFGRWRECCTTQRGPRRGAPACAATWSMKVRDRDADAPAGRAPGSRGIALVSQHSLAHTGAKSQTQKIEIRPFSGTGRKKKRADTENAARALCRSAAARARCVAARRQRRSERGSESWREDRQGGPRGPNWGRRELGGGRH